MSTSAAQVSREELEALVGEYRHLREEHRRAHPESRVRRRLQARLRELEAHFERLVHEWLPDERLRAEWRAHLFEDAAEPAEPAPKDDLVFRGRNSTGSVVSIRRRSDGDCDVDVDGRLAERLEGPFDIHGKDRPGSFTVDGRVYHELFSASERALEALEDFVTEREAHPPWRFAGELAADGLVDRNFGLTARGRRALRRAPHG